MDHVSSLHLAERAPRPACQHEATWGLRDQQDPRFVSHLTRDTYAMVLAGGRGSRLESLTDWRAKPAVPFAGKFRIIDFTLANCINSGVRRIGVVTQYKAQSLIRHLQRGWSFLDGRIRESIDILPALYQVEHEGMVERLFAPNEAREGQAVPLRVVLRATRPPDGLIQTIHDDTPIDLAFIDADKGGYRTYLDLLLPKLADHGMIVVDNVLWSGTVVDPGPDPDHNLRAITAFNDHVVARDDCDVAMLPVGDGVSLITRRR